jgi:hypothetical protein
MVISLIASLLKRLGAVCLAFVIIWHVTQHAAPRLGKAIVHVSQSDVVVIVDQRDYSVRTFAESPVICELEPGDHTVQVWRRGVLLGEEHFTVESGKETVVAPFDRPHSDTHAATDPTVPTAQPNSGPSLAVRIRRPTATAIRN